CEIAHSVSPDRSAAILEATVARALARAGCLVAEVDFIVSGLDEESACEAGAERHVIERLSAHHPPTHLPMREVAGECFSANTALQLIAAGLLLEQAGAGHTAVVIGMSKEGNLGCAVLRSGEKDDADA